jgi:hypothetical protein
VSAGQLPLSLSQRPAAPRLTTGRHTYPGGRKEGLISYSSGQNTGQVHSRQVGICIDWSTIHSAEVLHTHKISHPQSRESPRQNSGCLLGENDTILPLSPGALRRTGYAETGRGSTEPKWYPTLWYPIQNKWCCRLGRYRHSIIHTAHPITSQRSSNGIVPPSSPTVSTPYRASGT